VFVAKLLAGDGAHVWSNRFGSEGFQAAHHVAADEDGDVLVTGEYSGTLDFNEEALTALGAGDLFVAKLSAADGKPLWSKSYGDAGASALLATTRQVTADAGGNVILAGKFAGTLDFGGGPLASVQEDIYLAKLNSSGAHVWSKRFGDSDNAPNTQAANGMSADIDGSILLTGLFQGAVDFGCGPLTSAGSSDGFVTRFSP